MTAKVTFKPTGPEATLPGHAHASRTWEIKRDGAVIGVIESSLRDLYGDFANPGYSVVVSAQIYGEAKTFRKASFAMDNRSVREARGNISHYVNQAKDWAKRTCAFHDKQSSGVEGV
jgi:hypothetical protein